MTAKEGPRLAPPAADETAGIAASAGAATSDAPDARRAASEVELEFTRRTRARGTPMPLNQGDVDALVRGEISPSLANKIASRPLERFERPAAAVSATFAPVRLDAEDLSQIEAKGRASRKFDKSIDRASLQSAPSTAREATGKAAPDRAPERSGEIDA